MLLETLEGNMFPSLLQLLEVALNPWFVAPSSNPTTLTPASIVTVPFLTLLTPSFSYKDPCDYIGHNQITQDHLKIIIFNHMC